MQKENRYYILTFLSWAGLVLIWYGATNFGLVKATLIPSPEQVGKAFVRLIREGYNSISFFHHLKMSLGRLFLAVILAIVTAIPLGLLSGYFHRLSALIDSFVHFYRPLPPMAYYVLLIMWLGIDEESKIMLLYLATFAPIYIACNSAVAKVEKEYLLSAKTLGANSWQIFYHIILSATAPDIFIGIRTAVGVGYTTLVSAEMIAATSGIGWMVMDAYNYLKTDIVFVAIIVMGITGIIIDFLLKKIGNKLIHWADK